jgi:hypothetical protein
MTRQREFRQHPRAAEPKRPQVPPNARAYRQPDATPRRAEPRDRKDRTAQPPPGAPKFAPGRAEQPGGRPDRPRIGESPRPEGAGRQQIRREQVSVEQRRRVRSEIFKQRRVHRIPRNRANFALSVGTRVPRHVRLHRLWPAIFAFAPLYRDYSYFAVEDTICIVDPDTYTIVDVIPADIEEAAAPPPARPALALSAADMRFVWENVDKDEARRDLRIRLALGATIPDDVVLFRFHEGIVDRVRQLEAFRYVVVDNDVVIVDPNDRSVALVISE